MNSADSVQSHLYVSTPLHRQRRCLDNKTRLDDPVVWGVLPARFYRDSRMTRWTLGASDIMFTNPYVAHCFKCTPCADHGHIDLRQLVSFLRSFVTDKL